MPCLVPGGPSADTEATEQIRRATLEAMQSEQLTEMQELLDKLHDLPIVDKRDLEQLSISCGPMLDVDNFSSAAPTLHQSRFFMPCDWAQDWLEYETWSHSGRWIKMDHIDPYASSNLSFPVQRSDWFQARLVPFARLYPDVWDNYIDQAGVSDSIGLHLPHREFRRIKRLGGLDIYHEYLGMFTSLARLGTDKPHAQCCVADSADKVTDDIVLRSEIETAIAMCQYQLRDGFFVDHHTKPILIATVLRDQKGRLMQAYLDAKQNKLILRQSRLLNLSGTAPGPDAWLMLRWMASTPVGLTKYPDSADEAKQNCDHAPGVAPAIVLPDLC